MGPVWGGTDVGNGMPVGLVLGQTARLQVLHPPEPIASCPVELRFFDSEGNMLDEALKTVAPGHVVFLDWTVDEVRGSSGERVQIYGRVDLQRANRRVCKGLIAVLEVFDNATLKTMVVVHPPNPVHPPVPIHPSVPVVPRHR